MAHDSYRVSKIPFYVKETDFFTLHEGVLGSGDIGTLIHNLGSGCDSSASSPAGLLPGKEVPIE